MTRASSPPGLCRARRTSEVCASGVPKISLCSAENNTANFQSASGQSATSRSSTRLLHSLPSAIRRPAPTFDVRGAQPAPPPALSVQLPPRAVLHGMRSAAGMWMRWRVAVRSEWLGPPTRAPSFMGGLRAITCQHAGGPLTIRPHEADAPPLLGPAQWGSPCRPRPSASHPHSNRSAGRTWTMVAAGMHFAGTICPERRP